MFNDLSNSLGSEWTLVSLYHFYQSLHLLLVFLSNFFVAFDLELQTFGLVNPIDPFAPGGLVVKFLEYFLELFLGGDHVLLLRVDNQVIVFCKKRN
jgi:hypothetical protein